MKHSTQTIANRNFTSRQQEDRRQSDVSPHWPKALVQARDLLTKTQDKASPTGDAIDLLPTRTA